MTSARAIKKTEKLIVVTEGCETVANNVISEIRVIKMAVPIKVVTIWRFPMLHTFTFFSGIALGEPGWPG